MDYLIGFNAVEAALSAERRTVERVWVERGRDRGRLNRLRELARKHHVPVEEVDRARLQRLVGGGGVGRDPDQGRHQGVVASVAALEYASPEAVLERCGPDALVLAADGVEDPRNLGALVRTAAAAGAAGLFIPERRAVGLSATVARAAAGALESFPVARVGNMVAFLKVLKEEGFWVIGLDASGETAWDAAHVPARTALVVGGEGRGLRRLVRETCDQVASIPLAGGVESLNLTVAAGVFLYEMVRRRRQGGGGA